LAPDYVGFVASPKRFAEMRALLADKAPAAALAGIKNPAGLDLGARLPEEIALSILAEIVKLRREASPERPGDAPPVAAPEQARDPVCGMSVPTAGAKHRAEHQGREFLFCGKGCRERFVAAPERYLDAVAR
jgi:xanthine dehydrogenase accessory factor